MSRVHRSLTSKDLYRSYVMQSHAKGEKPLPWPEYRIIVEAMGKVMSGHLLNNGIIGLTKKHGDIIVKDKRKLGSVFGVHTVDGQKQSVTFFNDHSDNVAKMFYWVSANRTRKKASVWLFSAHRTVKRELARRLKGGQIYPDYTKLLSLK